MENKNNRKLLMLSLFAISIVIGLSSTLVGLLTTKIISTYNLNYSNTGLMSTLYNMGGLVSLFLTALIADKIPKKKIIWLLMLVFSVSLLLMMKDVKYGICLLVITLVGVCVSVLNSVISAYIAEQYPNDNGQKVNMVGVMFALGTIIGPIFTNVLLNDGLSWNHVYAYTGILGLLVLCLFNIGNFLARKSKVDKQQEEDEYIEIEVPKNRSRALIIVSIIVFLEIGQRCEFVSWFPTFLENKGLFLTNIHLLMTIYYASEFIGKFAYGFAIDKVPFQKYTLVASLVGTISVGMTLFINNELIIVIATILLGLSCGSIFPAGIATACKYFPENTGVMSAIVCLASNLGGVIFCYLTGVVADLSSIFIAGLMMPACLIIILPLSIYLHTLIKK